MNSSIMEDASVPVIVDAVRDATKTATKAVGSKLQGPIHKLHDVHVPNIHVPAVHVPHRAKRRRLLNTRNVMLLAGLGVVVGVIVMMRRRNADQIDA